MMIVYILYRDREQTRAIFERHRPNYVIHLAALVGGLFRNMKQKVEFYRENVLINDNVMEACKDFKVKIEGDLCAAHPTILMIHNSCILSYRLISLSLVYLPVSSLIRPLTQSTSP